MRCKPALQGLEFPPRPIREPYRNPSHLHIDDPKRLTRKSHWINQSLRCASCARDTWRPPRSVRPCSSCGGALAGAED
jgi:hypothetical protein